MSTMPHSHPSTPSLSNRELQVLAYQTCLSRPGISQELAMSPTALRRHISAIARKLTSHPVRSAAPDAGDVRPDDSCWPFV